MAQQQRVDLYGSIHKALRACMNDTLGLIGRMDPQDDTDRKQALAQLRELLVAFGGHLHHENDFVHPAMEARRPGSAAAIAADHVEHEEALALLAELGDALERAGAADREAAAAALYRRLALFVADNLQHMHIEETEHNALLWAHYSDAELEEIHQRLVAAVPPEKMRIYLRWMLPALSHAERVAMLAGMRQGAPREVFDGVLSLTRAHLRGRDWSKLSEALGLGGIPALAAYG